jgi:Flp pilus assembly pilin Flp
MSDAVKDGFTSRFVRRLTPRILRRFARKDDGAAAIEFAMVAAPFLALVFAILETAIVFFAGQVLETATADSARLIMTGQAQKAGCKIPNPIHVSPPPPLSKCRIAPFLS